MASATIVILNYNGKKYLEKFLPGILKTNNNYPVVIGDNASTDNSRAFLRAQYPEVKLIEFDKNYGYCGGYNRLIAQIETDLVVIMNSDVSTSSNWLTPLINFLENHPETAAVQPKILAETNPEYFEYAGASGGYLDKFGYPFCRGRVFNHIEKDTGQYDEVKEIFWATGACFVVRRKVFLEAGGFDDEFFAHMEEIDLCWRMQRLGHMLFVVPSSTVYHVGGGTLAYDNPLKTYLNYRNGLNLLIKNLPKSTLWLTVSTRVIFDWLSIGYYLVQGKFRLALAVCRAHWNVLLNITQTLNQRKKFNTEHPGSNVPELPKLILIWHYFVKRKVTYKELIPD
jgi:GT2 family glycosyltransferase